MSVSSDSAEQLMRLYIEGTNYSLRIAGSAIKNIMVALYAISKDQSKSKGKTRLNNMLKSEKELKIFSVKREDMAVFAKEAKSYGVLYCALVNKSNRDIDGMIDIMVKTEDAPKVNRIIERFKLTTVNKATIKSEIEKERADNQNDVSENNIDTEIEEKNIDDNMIDDIFSKPVPKEENPLEAQTEKSPPLEHSLMSNNNSEGVTNPAERRSVKKDLEEIKAGQKVEAELKETQKSKVTDLIDNNKNITIEMPTAKNKERGKL